MFLGWLDVSSDDETTHAMIFDVHIIDHVADDGHGGGGDDDDDEESDGEDHDDDCRTESF
jgi:hypothetical protein